MFMFLPLPAIYKCFFFPSKSNLYFVFAGTHFRAHRHCQTSQTPRISCGLWRTTTQSLEHPQERVQDIPTCTVRLAAQVQSFQRTSKHTNGPEIRRWCEAVVAVVKTKMGSTNEAPVSLFSQADWLIDSYNFFRNSFYNQFKMAGDEYRYPKEPDRLWKDVSIPVPNSPDRVIESVRKGLVRILGSGIWVCLVAQEASVLSREGRAGKVSSLLLHLLLSYEVLVDPIITFYVANLQAFSNCSWSKLFTSFTMNNIFLPFVNQFCTWESVNKIIIWYNELFLVKMKIIFNMYIKYIV